jgi:general secretion pathway protein D
LQVHVEAQVVEVTLTGDLSYGVSWFFGNAIKPSTDSSGNPVGDLDEYNLSQTTNQIRTFASTISPAGAAWTFIGPNAKAVVSLLDTMSDVNMLAAPSLMVRNNVEASFDSGEQIPVVSTVLNQDNGNNNTVSQVQFRQTGISLKVKPRVSSNGMVFLDITQDVSAPVGTADRQGNVRVSTNKLKTEAAIQSGETVILAGLIKSENGKKTGGIPFLSRLPIVGALFGQQSRSKSRKEILVLITPTIIRDPSDARKFTDEYGERFKALEPLRKAREKNKQ